MNITNGPVIFAGNTAGNLFGNSLVLNVEAGASFNFESNGESMGGIEGAGNIIQGTVGITCVEPGDRTYSGSISGTGGLAHDVANTLTLIGFNSYTGTTTIEAFGTILCGAPYVLSPNSLVNVTAGGNLNLGGYNQSIAGLAGGNNAVSLPLGNSTLNINNTSTSIRIFNSPLTGTGSVIISGTGV